MRIILMTDSHDNLPMLHKAVSWCNDNCIDHVLHAGDLVAPFTHKALKNLNMPYSIVFGNNDGERQGLSVMFKDKIFTPPYELQLDAKKIVMLHEPEVMESLNLQAYDLVLYGHTHVVDIRKEKPMIINPGELGGWLTGRSTMALWDTQNNNVDLIELND